MNRVKLWAFKTERHVCVSLLQRTHTHTHTLRNNLVNLSKTSSFNLGDCSFWITHCFQKAHSVPSLRKGLMMNRSWISNSYNRQRVCVYSIALGILKPYFIDNRFVCLCVRVRLIEVDLFSIFPGDSCAFKSTNCVIRALKRIGSFTIIGEN